MNIFYTDHNPKIAATNLCDKHIPKMLLESVQMLCTAHQHFTNKRDIKLYKPCYVNHPMNVWLRQSYNNWMWLFAHAKTIADEYTFRFSKIQKSKSILYMFKPIDGFYWDNTGITNIPQCMPDKYKHDDSVTAYRNYYLGEKLHIAKYQKGRDEPYWFNANNIRGLSCL